MLHQIMSNEYNFVEITGILVFALGGINPLCSFLYMLLETCCKLLVMFRLGALVTFRLGAHEING